MPKPMQIQVKLMGVLKDKTPAGGHVELPDEASILDVLAALEIPPESVQVFTVNGRIEHDKNRTLAAGDELSILPPAVGG